MKCPWPVETLGTASENYLKEIYVLERKQGEVRSIDLAVRFGYARASVCNAVKNLQQKGLIIMHDDKTLSLTEDGKKLAMQLYKRYEIIYRFFVDYLAIDTDTASIEACGIEHSISDATCMQLEALMHYRYEDVQCRQILTELNCI